MAHVSDPHPTGVNYPRGEQIERGKAANQSDTTALSRQPDDTITYPDGGSRAWIVVGATCCAFSTFGFVNAWGVFQSHYEVQTLKDTLPFDIAWIGSIQYSLVFLPGLIPGRLLDLGYFRVPFTVGAFLVVVSTLLVAHCVRYWHFLACQGIAIGVSLPSVTLITEEGCPYNMQVGRRNLFWANLRDSWPLVFGEARFRFGFDHGRKLYRGDIISYCLSKAYTHRGVRASLASQSQQGRVLSDLFGRYFAKFPWTMRVMALINFTMLGISSLALTPRLPPKDLPGGLFNLKVFRSAPFTIYSVSGLVSFLGFYTVLTFIDVTAIRSGISPDFSFYLVSISNASSGLGRVATGLLVDKFGAVNIITPMSFLAAIMTFAWLYAIGQGSLIAVAIIYGFSTSAFLSAFNIPIYGMGEMGDIGRRLGMVMMFRAAGALCGPPISGAINRATGDIKAVSYYAGSAVLVSILMMLLTKRLVLGHLWGNF